MKRAAAAAVALVIGWATLHPQPELGAAALEGCLLCQPRAVADALLNVALFLPAGLVLGSMMRPLAAVAVAGVLSALIELAQGFIPGRDPHLGDVLFNTLGAALGIVVLRVGRGWLRPSPRLGLALGMLWAAAAIGVVFLTGWLLQPVAPPGPYGVQWTPALPYLEAYGGEVLGAQVGNVRLRPGPARGAEHWGELAARGVPLAVQVRLGPSPERLAPLLTIEGADDARALLLGVDGTDLVFQRHTRARRWRLDSPELRAPGLLAGHSAGDAVLIATVALPIGQCFVVDRTSACGFGHDAGDGWRLLYRGSSLAAWVQQAASAAWLALLVLPIGFWAGGWRAVGLGLAVAWYAWFRGPYDTVLLAPAWLGAGFGIGLLAGLGLRALVSVPRGGLSHYLARPTHE